MDTLHFIITLDLSQCNVGLKQMRITMEESIEILIPKHPYKAKNTLMTMETDGVKAGDLLNFPI